MVNAQVLTGNQAYMTYTLSSSRHELCKIGSFDAAAAFVSMATDEVARSIAEVGRSLFLLQAGKFAC